MSCTMSEIKHLFMRPLAISMPSLEKAYSVSLPIFEIRIVVSLVFIFINSLCLFDVNPLSNILFVNTFSHSGGCLVVSWMVFLAV